MSIDECPPTTIWAPRRASNDKLHRLLKVSFKFYALFVFNVDDDDDGDGDSPLREVGKSTFLFITYFLFHSLWID